MSNTHTHDSSTPPHEVRHFRVNPVEILILLTMTVVVGNSAYNLLYGTDSFHPDALKPMAANPASEGRTLASVPSSSFANLEVKCFAENVNGDMGPRPASVSTANDHETSANKVRLTGTLCGSDGITGSQLVKATVLNSSNRFNATVFTDSNSPQFTTDYIPLAAGKNTLRLEFAYRGGKTHTQEITVSKLEANAGTISPGSSAPNVVPAAKTEFAEPSDASSEAQPD
jgi:hypothetical protein